MKWTNEVLPSEIVGTSFSQRLSFEGPYNNLTSGVLNVSFVDGTMGAPCYVCTPFTLSGGVMTVLGLV